MVLVKLAEFLPANRLDRLLALYLHGRFGNYDESANMNGVIIDGARRMGLPPLRPQVFDIWKNMYRRADASLEEFILTVQDEERTTFGSNELYEMLLLGRK